MNMKKKFTVRKLIFIIIILITISALIFLASLPHLIMSPILGRRIEGRQYLPLDYDINPKEVSLITEDGLTLAAWHNKISETKGTVIILSGIENPSVTAFFGYAKMLEDSGWDSLLIEMRARNLSEGKEVGLGYLEWNDVIGGLNYLSKDLDIDNLPTLVMGTSMGASAAIMAAGQDSRIDGVISISAFSSWEDAFEDNMTLMDVPPIVCSLERPFVKLYCGLHYGFATSNYSPLKGLEDFGDRPILLMHSTEDSQVPYPSFKRLKDQAEKYNLNLSTFIREGDEHFICYEEYFDNPSQDIEFSNSIITFLSDNF